MNTGSVTTVKLMTMTCTAFLRTTDACMAATNEPGDRGRPHHGCMCHKRARRAARACSGAASRWSHHGVSAIAPVDLGKTEVYRWAAPAADVGPTTTSDEPSKSAGR